MIKITRALKNAFVSCLDLRILVLMFVPLLLALIVGFVLFLTLGTVWIASLSESMQHSSVAGYLNGSWISPDLIGIASSVFAVVLVVLLIVPVAYLAAVIIVSIILMPILISIVAKKNFPTLEKKKGGTIAGNIWNTLKASSVYFFLLVITLPLWLIPGVAVVLPVLL
ncbi:MAG: hypothetical protein EOP09_11740, partial [Proteobacteria bacterium]